jgi:ATP:ADP antiporter, AAA family
MAAGPEDAYLCGYGPHIMNTETRAGSPFDRMLRLFADVRAGEGVTAILLSLNVFLILTAYYVLKPVREALILSEGSAARKTYLSAAQVLMLAAIVPLYGRLVKRLPRRRLINTVTAFFILCLFVFYLLGRAGVKEGVAFFLWIGIFNMMIVAQFWSFANDLYSKDEGERLFPIVGFGASLGAVLGARLSGDFINLIGLFEVMLVGAALLVTELLLTNYIDIREAAHERHSQTSVEHQKMSNAGAFALVLRTRYLLLIALMVAIYNTVNTTGEFLLSRTVQEHVALAVGAANQDAIKREIGTFYSQFFATVNIVGLLLQMFVVSRIVKWFGVPIAVVILPLVSLGAYGIIAFLPILRAVFVAKVSENATDYSLNNTVRAMLFLPCTTEQKYSGKQAIDSFFSRLGDLGAALVVFIGTTVLALSTSLFAVVNAGLVLIWLGLAWQIGRFYRDLSITGRPPESSAARDEHVVPELSPRPTPS